MESVEKSKRSKTNPEYSDRIVLRKEEQQKLDGWVTLLNAEFEGTTKLTKSDLANFLIRQHSADLTDAEVAIIKSENYDEVKWINWALVKIREAKREGNTLTLDELMRKRVQPSSASRKEKPTRKKAAKSANNETDIGDYSFPNFEKSSEV